MEYTIQSDSNQRLVNLKGRLTFTDHEQFRKITEAMHEPGSAKCTLDVSGLEFIDSAGLGLLLLVNEAAKENDISVSIRGAQDQVKKMLEITRFEEMIPIE